MWKWHQGKASQQWSWSAHLPSPGAVLVRLVSPLCLVHWCWRLPPDQTLVTCQACPVMGSSTATDPHAHPAVKAFQFLIAPWLVRFNRNHMATIKTFLIMRGPNKGKKKKQLWACFLSLVHILKVSLRKSFNWNLCLHGEQLNGYSLHPDNKTKCLCLHLGNISEILAGSPKVYFHSEKNLLPSGKKAAKLQFQICAPHLALPYLLGDILFLAIFSWKC